MKRIPSIDIIRGLAMVIMALDHVRDLMHESALTQSPTDLNTTTPVLFFTRWITYICAPVFVFLAGTSASISSDKKGHVTSSRIQLIKRGLWLILFDLILVNLVLYFDLQFHTILFGVVASIGFGLIVLGIFLKVNTFVTGMLGIAIIFGHDLYPVLGETLPAFVQTILTPFFSLSVYSISTGKNFIIAYPPIPWLGMMLLGFSLGKLFALDSLKRNNFFKIIGMSTLVLFILIRSMNGYGDPQKWTIQKDITTTLLSFLNVSKYPPSISFTLVTMGIMFLLLGFADSFNSSIKNILVVYGKVPLFYFIVHFLLIHVMTIAILLLQGFQWSDLEFATSTFGRPQNQESGVPLWVIHLLWPAVVALLYNPCKWYGRYKEKKANLLTKYL